MVALVGARVVLVSLVRCAHLNGREGYVEARLQNGRVRVKLTGESLEVDVQAHNIRAVAVVGPANVDDEGRHNHAPTYSPRQDLAGLDEQHQPGARDKLGNVDP